MAIKGCWVSIFLVQKKRLPCESLHVAGNYHTLYKQRGLESDFHTDTCISSVQLLSPGLVCREFAKTHVH